jgi:hypothetical protein
MISILLGLASVASGCAAQPQAQYALRFETSGTALSAPDAEKLASTTDISALASVNSTDAVTMRATVLTDLRTRGELGQRAGDLLSAGFPEQTSAVPILVRASVVDGVDAVIVVEAFGSDGSNLIHRRLWVFDRATGAIIRAASFR